MRIRPSCWRPSLAFAVLALLSLVAAACGDDDDSEPAGSTVESEAPTTSADDGEAEAPADSDDGEAEAPADSGDGEAEAPADSGDGEAEAPADSGDGDAGASTPAEVVELTVLTGFTGGDRAAYEQIVNRFNMAHDDIKVTMDIQPWDSIAQTLPTAWGTGGGPDIATPNFDPGIVFRYVDDGLALPLDDLIGTGDGQLDPAVVPQFVIDAFTIDGSLYAAPGNVATLQLYYNKDLLDAGGISAPPATAEDFAAYASQLTGDGIFGVSLADHATIQMWPLLIWMNGGDVMESSTCSALDDQATIDALALWTDLVANEGVSPIGQTGGESDTLFAAGKAVLQMNGPWAAPGYRDAGINLGVAPIPAGPDGQVTLASAVPLVVSASTDHPAEAQRFLAFWNSADVQREFALASGFPPTRTDLADDPDLAANEVVAQFASALPDARLYLPGVRVASQVDNDVFVPLIGSITRGADVAESAAAAADAADQLAGCGG